MSLHDPYYPGDDLIEAANRSIDLAVEVERLRSWKAEATEVIRSWELVWEALGRPGRLGESKAAAVLHEAERLREALQSAALGLECCSIGGFESDPNHVIGVYDDIRAALDNGHAETPGSSDDSGSAQPSGSDQ